MVAIRVGDLPPSDELLLVQALEGRTHRIDADLARGPDGLVGLLNIGLTDTPEVVQDRLFEGSEDGHGLRELGWVVQRGQRWPS